MVEKREICLTNDAAKAFNNYLQRANPVVGDSNIGTFTTTEVSVGGVLSVDLNGKMLLFSPSAWYFTVDE